MLFDMQALIEISPGCLSSAGVTIILLVPKDMLKFHSFAELFAVRNLSQFSLGHV